MIFLSQIAIASCEKIFLGRTIMFNKLFGGKNTWSTYQDMLGDKKLSVRVDTKYVGKKYSHTYYVQVRYSEEATTDLPSKSFLEKIANLEAAYDRIAEEEIGEAPEQKQPKE